VEEVERRARVALVLTAAALPRATADGARHAPLAPGPAAWQDDDNRRVAAATTAVLIGRGCGVFFGLVPRAFCFFFFLGVASRRDKEKKNENGKRNYIEPSLSLPLTLPPTAQRTKNSEQC
jgi:hypothetical protein